MPKLLMFCGCERLLVDPSNNTLSLVGILEELTVPVVGTDQVPGDAVAPISWRAFALWKKDTDEDDVEFEQRVSLRLPDGNHPVETRIKFKFGANDRMRTDSPIIGFPISIPGGCLIALELRRAGDDEFKRFAEYDVKVIHVKAAEVQPVPAPES